MDPLLTTVATSVFGHRLCVVLVLIGEYVGDKHRQAGQGL